jgi:hypothetical protein
MGDAVVVACCCWLLHDERVDERGEGEDPNFGLLHL